MTAITKTPDTWTRWNHRFESGVTKDGYAVCVQCDATENSDKIIQPCPKGPVIQQSQNAKQQGK